MSLRAASAEAERTVGQPIRKIKDLRNGYTAPRPRAPRTVPWILDEESQKYVCENIYPENDVLFSGERTHKHAKLAMERSRSEELCYAGLRANHCVSICDVGGSPRRHLGMGRPEVHSCNPVMDVFDVSREAQRVIIDGLDYCESTCDTCVDAHGEDDGKFSGLMLIHSLPYISPELLAFTMSRTTRKIAYAATHTFGDYEGSFALGEARWKRHGDQLSQVEMLVTGGTPYSHSAMDWLNRASYRTQYGRLVWSVEHVVGSTTVIKFHLTSPARGEELDEVIPSVATSVGGSLALEYEGPIDFRSFAKTGVPMNRSGVTALYAPDRQYYSFGKFVYGLERGNKILRVPKQAIATVALKLAGRPRTADLWQYAYSAARNVLKSSSISETDMVRCIPFVTAAAFMLSIEDEMTSLAIIGDKTELMAEHQAQTGFKFSQSWWNWVRRYFFGSLSVTEWHPPKSAEPFKFTGWMRIAGGILGVLAFAALTARKVHTPMAFWHPFIRLGRKIINFVRTCIRPSSTMILPTEDAMFQDVCAWPRPLVEIHESATIRYDETEIATCRPKFGNQLIGVGVTTYVPTVYRSCICNEVLAVNNRGLLDRGDDASYEPFWLAAWQWYQDCPTIRTSKIKPIPFQIWVLRYPGVKQIALQAAYHNFQAITNMRDILPKKSFVKRENAVNMHVAPDNAVDKTDAALDDPISLSDPRLIQGCLDEHKVRLGPWMVAFSKALAAEWCGNIQGQRRNYYYTSGSDANAVGHWYKQCSRAVDRILHMARILGLNWQVVWDELDYGRFDATNNRPCLDYSSNIYRRHGITKKANAAIEDQKRVKGCTAHGVQYSIEATNASGGDDTSTGNTKRNQAAKAAAIRLIAIWSSHAFLGDDSFGPIIYDADACTPQDIYNAMHQITGRCAGFRPEPKLLTNKWDGTYCSSRFWPAEVHGKNTYILGPKIGRVLAKTFYSIRCLNATEARRQVRGIALGMVNDVAHIPILRVLIPRLLEITSDIQHARATVDYKFHASVSGVANDETWEFVEHVYQLPASHFHEVERIIEAHLWQIPAWLDIPALNDICAVDVPAKGREIDPISLVPEAGPLQLTSDWSDMPTPDLVSHVFGTDDGQNLACDIVQSCTNFQSRAQDLPNDVGRCAQWPNIPLLSVWTPIIEMADRVTRFLAPTARDVVARFNQMSTWSEVKRVWLSPLVHLAALSPYVEEFAKASSIMRHAIPAIEAISDYMKGNLIRIPVRFIHYAWGGAPLLVGTILHSLWNYSAMNLYGNMCADDLRCLSRPMAWVPSVVSAVATIAAGIKWRRNWSKPRPVTFGAVLASTAFTVAWSYAIMGTSPAPMTYAQLGAAKAWSEA